MTQNLPCGECAAESGKAKAEIKKAESGNPCPPAVQAPVAAGLCESVAKSAGRHWSANSRPVDSWAGDLSGQSRAWL